jgi:hypothetical protein
MSKTNESMVNQAIEIVAKFYDVLPEQIFGKSRLDFIVKPRFIVMYILREEFYLSFPFIANKVGRRDHTTAIYAYNKIKKIMEKDLGLRHEIGDILAKLRGQKEHIERDVTQTLGADKGRGFSKVLIKKARRRLIKINPVLSDRENKILTGWHAGRTLEDISHEHNITRERIRQIVAKAISKEIARKQLEGFEIDTSEFLKQEKNNHATLRKNKSITPEDRNKTIENTKRWSRYYNRCRKCGTIVVPHHVRGFCEECSPRGLRDKRRVDLILSAGNKCSVCGLTQPESFRKFGRDLYVTRKIDHPKDYMVMCRQCFLDYTGKKMVEGRKNSRKK